MFRVTDYRESNFAAKILKGVQNSQGSSNFGMSIGLKFQHFQSFQFFRRYTCQRSLNSKEVNKFRGLVSIKDILTWGNYLPNYQDI